MTEADRFFTEYFDRSKDYYTRIVTYLVTEPGPLVERAGERFARMGPELAYAENREHPMAGSLFSCAALLALYLEARTLGTDVHDFGRQLIAEMAKLTEVSKKRREARGDAAGPAREAEALRQLASAADDSRDAARPGAFVFEVAVEDEAAGAWTMNVTSCAICHLYGAHDAMALVPYMCATDDLMSDLADSGLERTGTIALGRPRCDFSYRSGRPTRHLASLYPERIRLEALDPA